MITDCLCTTKALQLIGEAVEEVAGLYSRHGVEGLASVEALLKELSYPETDHQVEFLLCVFVLFCWLDGSPWKTQLTN